MTIKFKKVLSILFVVIILFVLLSILSQFVIFSNNSDNNSNQIFINELNEKYVKNCRKFQNYRQELELNANIKIRPKVCISRVVTIFVYSVSEIRGKYFDRREIARNTWVKDALHHNICVYFVIAKPNDNTVQRLLELEALRNQDIIQFGFNEGYYNLTLKTISILYYVQNNGIDSKLIMKADDDIVINIRLLVETSHSFKSGITGRVIAELKPERQDSGKQYLPENIYPNKTFPKFTTGLSYILSKDCISSLIKAYEHYPGPIIDIEDVFITGIIAEFGRVVRYDRKEFCSSYKCPKRVCFMFDCIVFNGCETSIEINNFWIKWKELTPEFCFDYLQELIALLFFILLILIAVNFFYFK